MKENCKTFLWWLVFVAAAFGIVTFFTGCGTCRQNSIRTAEQWADRGETRIGCYYHEPVDPSIGNVLWKSHCQAQVRQGDDWLWIAGDETSLTPEYPFKRVDPELDYWYWSVEEYKKLIDEDPRHDWWKIALVFLLI